MAKTSKAPHKHFSFQNTRHVQQILKQTRTDLGKKIVGSVYRRYRNPCYGIRNTMFFGHDLW